MTKKRYDYLKECCDRLKIQKITCDRRLSQTLRVYIEVDSALRRVKIPVSEIQKKTYYKTIDKLESMIKNDLRWVRVLRSFPFLLRHAISDECVKWRLEYYINPFDPEDEIERSDEYVDWVPYMYD